MCTPRKTMSQTVAENQLFLSGMCRLMGKPEYKPSIELKAVNKRTIRSEPKESESAIQKSIMAYLRLLPDVAWVCRQNSGTFVDGDRYISANSQKGMSDILGMLKGGRLFAIEVKSKSGKLMPHQAEFLKLIADGGGLSGVARSIDDVTAIISG